MIVSMDKKRSIFLEIHNNETNLIGWIDLSVVSSFLFYLKRLMN